MPVPHTRTGKSACPPQRRYEHRRDLHPPPCHDDARHGRHPPLRHHGLPRAAGQRPAERRLPDHQRHRLAPRRRPGDDGRGRGDAAGEAVLDDRRPRHDDLVELPRLDLDHPAVQPLPQHRRGRAGRAVGDRRGGAAAAAEHAVAAVVQQGQPRRPADPLPRAHLGHDAALRARRVRRDRSWRSASPPCRASPRSSSTAPRNTPCASSSTRAQLATRGIGIDEVANAITNSNVNLPTGVLQRAAHRLHRAGQRAAPHAPATIGRSSSPTATARRCA